MKRAWFVQVVERLLETASESATAILCSEEDPASCHRHHLITRDLIETYPEVEVHHIRGDGSIYGARSIMKSVNDEQAKQPKLF